MAFLTLTLQISSGERITTKSGLQRFIETNTIRAQGKGYAALAARNLLDRLETILGKKV